MTEHELDTLLRDYGGAVRSVCRAILPGHPQDAEEAEADTFYKLWRGAHLPADETHRRRLVVQAARQCAIDRAENGKIAVEKVMEAPEKWYDLIFMDIQMPIMNGYEATAAIRSLAGSRGKVPIIAMTANAFAEDVQLAKNTGMNEHIAKPLDLNKLNDVLKQWL